MHITVRGVLKHPTILYPNKGATLANPGMRFEAIAYGGGALLLRDHHLIRPAQNRALSLGIVGLTNRQGGEAIYHSPDTMKTNRRIAYRQLGCASMRGAIRTYFQEGLVEVAGQPPTLPDSIGDYELKILEGVSRELTYEDVSEDLPDVSLNMVKTAALRMCKSVGASTIEGVLTLAYMTGAISSDAQEKTPGQPAGGPTTIASQPPVSSRV